MLLETQTKCNLQLHIKLTLEYLMLPSRWLTARWNRSSSSTQGAGSAVVVRDTSTAARVVVNKCKDGIFNVNSLCGHGAHKIGGLAARRSISVTLTVDRCAVPAARQDLWPVGPLLDPKLTPKPCRHLRQWCCA